MFISRVLSNGLKQAYYLLQGSLFLKFLFKSVFFIILERNNRNFKCKQRKRLFFKSKIYSIEKSSKQFFVLAFCNLHLSKEAGFSCEIFVTNKLSSALQHNCLYKHLEYIKWIVFFSLWKMTFFWYDRTRGLFCFSESPANLKLETKKWRYLTLNAYCYVDFHWDCKTAKKIWYKRPLGKKRDRLVN